MKKPLQKYNIIIVMIIVTLIFSSCTSDTTQEKIYEPDQLSGENDYQLTPQQITTEIPPISKVVQHVSPSVVGLSVMYNETTGVEASGSLGSGVVVDKNGYIITNHHVIGLPGKIQVVFYDGSTLDGEVLWSDKNLDLAVVKVEGNNFNPMAMGSSKDMLVGETVIAIGTPLAMKFKHTVTAGIISAKNRTLSIPSNDGIAFMEDLLQTDASINPGNSGGPLINMKGEVIGINTLKVTEAEGMGFAIPIDICIPIVQHIIEDNNYTTPYLGIMAMDSEIAAYLDKILDKGVMVMAVDTTSPAYAAGIREGCVILAINGSEIDSVLELRKQIYALGADKEIEITYIKDEIDYTVKCNLKKGT